MALLAIKGHETRGNEVIEILEMLGGKNKQGYNGENNFLWHYINEHGDISIFTHVVDLTDFIFFTLKEFLEKFPYKVGDKVTLDKFPCEIKGMSWEYDDIIYYVEGADFSKGVYSKDKDLQPHKEEPMENKGTLVEIDLTREETKAEEIEVILGDYEFILKDGKTYFVKKKPQYPKTYKECFNIYFGNHHPVVQVVGLDSLGNNKSLFERFIKLKICRDVYWKIAGEQMGLGKPWKPTWNGSESCYCIFCDNGEILEDEVSYGNTILAFPTSEMRDAFKENFDDDIEFCKEFL